MRTEDEIKAKINKNKELIEKHYKKIDSLHLNVAAAFLDENRILEWVLNEQKEEQ